MARKTKAKWEFGDFQTPLPLAEAAVEALRRTGINPRSVLEPTCGKGAFLLAAIQAFPRAQRYVGVDVNPKHLATFEPRLLESSRPDSIDFINEDFFKLNWDVLLAELPQPLLILGNPPWVTSSELALLESANVPSKSNFQQRRGYDAITGKSNFDISEWMLLQHLEWLKDRRGAIAVLCKAAVARKVLLHAWKHQLPVASSSMFMVDAQKHFGASVDACFLVIDLLQGSHSVDCAVYNALDSARPSQTIGYHDAIVLSNVAQFSKWRHLNDTDHAYTWRSGIKHDCSKVMELEPEGDKYRNAIGELIALEDDYVYPMLKSSDIGNGHIRYGRKYMLVTQKYVGEDTNPIKRTAPRVWRYLESHSDLFEKRGSSIYRNRPTYSIFGVGDYSFSGWKVAISGFYKRLSFQVVEPFRDKAVVLDDTTYFLPCWSESEARFVAGLVNSEPALQFLESMIFWSDKRPITVEILKRLDLHALSRELGCEPEYQNFAKLRKDHEMENAHGQLSLGIAQRRAKYVISEEVALNKLQQRTGQKTARR